MKYFVYILECDDNSLYTGITTDLKRRVVEHSNGSSKYTRSKLPHSNGSSKYTRSKLPAKLVYSEEAENRTDAAKREREIKGWSRVKKLELVKRFTPN